jgi:ABC-type amino acid transport substrate-binding protein/ABC-type amino acid transport system permease subunit
MRRRFSWAIFVSLLGAIPLAAQANNAPDAALALLLDEARATAAKPDACTQPERDRLIGIFCAGHLRVGVRDDYPLFSMRSRDTRHGYEIDVARAVAQRLGVAIDFTAVKPATRIPMLADNTIDLVVATMADNTQRESQVRFVLPHYYQSQTVIVGPRDLHLEHEDIHGRTVCVTIGNGSNAELVSRGARLMLFDGSDALPARLSDQACILAAQDDTFFASYLNEPSFGDRFAEKFGFAQAPWGMGVALERTDLLARALSLMAQIFHRDGVFLAAAQANHVGIAFLRQQQQVWSQPTCNVDTGNSNRTCVLPPSNPELEPTPFANGVAEFEAIVFRLTGIELTLPMLKIAPAWTLFLDGVVNSLLLITGALAATLAFALLFGAAMSSRLRLLRWTARGTTIALQSSPILLTLVIAASIFHFLLPYSSPLVLCAATAALGLSNGANAGQAIAEAYRTLQAEHDGVPHKRFGLFLRALSRSATQIVAFLINAAKGTPIASFIGAPELLSALTDITSFSSGRATTYTLLLIFYTVVVIGVIWLCRRFQAILERGWDST